MVFFSSGRKRALPVVLALLSCAAWGPAWAQETDDGEALESDEAEAGYEGEAEDSDDTDILSGDTLTVILDARLVVADGANSWIDGGFGKTRFDGTADGDFEIGVHPVEA